MKNIINIIKNNISNDRGVVSGNIVKGLSVGVFAAIIIYGVYTSYNNSPAYNPARRGIFTGQNLSANALEGFTLNLDNSNSAQNSAAYNSGVIPTGDGFARANSVRNQFSKEEADFESAREYMASQKEAKAAQAQQAGNSASLNGKDSIRSSFNTVNGSAESIQDAQRNAKAKRIAANQGSVQSAQTQLNRLASSGSSFRGANGGSSSGGSSSSSSGGNLYASASDTASKVLPQNNIANAQAKADAFKTGRGGTMGGMNVSVGGVSGSDNGGKRGGEGDAKAQLMGANMYSTRAGKTLQTPGAKNLAQAKQESDNAFDGGGVTGGATIDGENVVDPGSTSLGGYDRDLGSSIKDIQQEWETDAEKKKRLFNNILLHMAFAAVATAFAVFAIINILRTKAWYTYAAAAAITLATLYAILGMDYDGDGWGIIRTLEEYDTLRHADGQNSVQGWFYMGMLAIFGGALTFAWIKGIRGGSSGEEIVEGMEKESTGFFGQYATGKAMDNVRRSATDAINKATNDEGN